MWQQLWRVRWQRRAGIMRLQLTGEQQGCSDLQCRCRSGPPRGGGTVDHSRVCVGLGDLKNVCLLLNCFSFWRSG